MFVVASPIDADAPLASARDTALLRRLLFEERFDIVPLVSSGTLDQFGLSGVVPGRF
jgi:hypothetical protein